MIVVIDASAAVEIALNKEFSTQYKNLLQVADMAIAPDTFISEITNVIWKYRKFSQFSDDTCISGIDFCHGLIDDYVNSSSIWREAYFEGVRHQHSTYDMFYLVVARRNNAVLITRDKRLNELSKSIGVKIVSD